MSSIYARKKKNSTVYEVKYKTGKVGEWKTKVFKTKKEAQCFLAEKQTELALIGKSYEPYRKTLNQFYEEFERFDLQHYAYNTIKTHESKYKNYIRDTLGDYKLIDIDYRMLQNFFNSLKNNGKSTNSKVRDCLNAIFTSAIKMNYIRENPVQLVKVVGEDTTRDKEIMEGKQLDELISLMLEPSQHDFLHKSLVVSLAIGYYVGLRVSEIFALEKSDFNFSKKTLSVKRKLIYDGLKKEEYYADTNLKSEKSKAEVPIADNLIGVLKWWFNINPYNTVICNDKGDYLNPKKAEKIIKRFAEKIGVNFHYHMLRATLASNLVNTGIDIKTVQGLMRHANSSVTLDNYALLNKSSERAALEKVFSDSVRCFSVDTPKLRDYKN